MTPDEFYTGIGLPDLAVRTVQQNPFSEDEYKRLKDLFYNNPNLLFRSIKSKPNWRELFLSLYTKLSIDAYEKYQKREISDSIYFDTFSDLTIWYKNCVRDFGEHGLNEYGWLWHHIKLNLFRLGRLQFEPVPLPHKIICGNRTFRKNEFVLNVHIPQGEPLVPEQCKKSYLEALRFFRGVDPVFVCESWLLYPQLQEMLKPDSNILMFQKRYHIYQIDQESRQAEERIFQKLEDSPEQYPETTQLQKSAKAYLLSGKKIGAGMGIFWLDL